MKPCGPVPVRGLSMELRHEKSQPEDPHTSAVRRPEEITTEFTAHQITSHQERPSRDETSASAVDDDRPIRFHYSVAVVTDADDFQALWTVASLAQSNNMGT